MRRTAAALLVPLLASVALVGCGSSSSGASANQSVTVSGSFGKSPNVTIPKQDAGSKLAVKTEIQGSGPVLASTNTALANLAIYVWSGKTHKLLDSTFQSAPQLVPAQVGLPGLATALKGAKMGSRILAVLPPKYGYGTSGNSQIGVSGSDTTVWVIDLIKQFAPSASASGTHVSNGGGALPTVSAASGTAPVITIPKTSPPSKLAVTTLIKGSGPKIAKGQTIVAQYVAVNWRTGKVFNSTWPAATTAGAAVRLPARRPGDSRLERRPARSHRRQPGHAGDPAGLRLRQGRQLPGRDQGNGHPGVRHRHPGRGVADRVTP